jgi:hypothetical protein
MRPLLHSAHSQKEWILPERHFRTPAKKVVKLEQTDEERLHYQQSDTGRYQLQIGRQTKRSFKTPEAERSAAFSFAVINADLQNRKTGFDFHDLAGRRPIRAFCAPSLCLRAWRMAHS